MITLKSDREIQAMEESGAILAGIHEELRDFIKPGLTTMEINNFVQALFGIIADGTGIQQDKVGRFNIGGRFVILGFENGGYNFAIRKIHLASISLYIGFLLYFHF